MVEPTVWPRAVDAVTALIAAAHCD
jgi:hypothetical protein